MREFINKKEYLYESDEEYYKEEERIVNSNETLNEEEYLDFDKLEFIEKYKIKPLKNDGYGKVLDKDLLIEEFINNFLKTFPNIYTKDQLLNILNNNISEILECTKEEMEKNVAGNYNQSVKMICLLEKSIDRTKFHEFIHALRGNEIDCNDLDGIIEGFTAYADLMYTVSKELKKQYNEKDKFIIFKDKKDWINLPHAYSPLVLLVQELEVLNSVIDPNETLLTSYLKRKNIFININKIYIKYYEELAKEENKPFNIQEYEFDIMRTSFELIQKFDSLKFLVSHKRDKNKIYLKINEIEEEIKEIFIVINKNPNLEYDLSRLLLTTEILTSEKRLLSVLFNEPITQTKKYTLTDRINKVKKVDM